MSAKNRGVILFKLKVIAHTALLGSILLLGYTNCSPGFKAVNGQLGISSNSPGVTGGGADPGGNDGLGPNTGNYISSKSLGTFDNNCINNTAYDACIFWKNPVASNQAPFAATVGTNTNLANVQTFGVKFKNRTNSNELTNGSISVIGSITQNPIASLPGINGLVNTADGKNFLEGSKIQLTNGQQRRTYSQDVLDNSHWLAQEMAYFWLESMESSIFSRTNIYYTRNKGIPVIARGGDFFSAAKNNAFFTPGLSSSNGSTYLSQGLLVLGYRSKDNNTHDNALSAEIYMHEMGHANLYHASSQAATAPKNQKQVQLQIGSTVYGKQTACISRDGCILAINEGIADFHSLIMFHESPILGETFENHKDGLSDSGVRRNFNTARSLSLDSLFQASGQAFTTNFPSATCLDSGTTKTVDACNGEVHVFAHFYTSILWDIYTDNRVNKADFETIFMEHLQNLQPQTTFPQTKQILLTIDQQFFQSKYKDVITYHYQQRGL